MKMFKKIMAVALTAVMAVSMLTGCAFKNENDMERALKLAGQTRSVTVEVDNDKKVGDKTLSAWAKEAAGVLDDEVDEDLTGRYTFGNGKIIAYVVKEQNSTKKWREMAGEVVDDMIGTAKDDNGKYSVAIDTFKAKKEADKDAKNDYVVVVVEAAEAVEP